MPLKNNYYVDFHCHPSMKPFGKSFNFKERGINSSNKSKTNSIWFYNPPNLRDKLDNFLFNLTKFSQSNFTSLTKGGIQLICVSLYPLEREFFTNNNITFLRKLKLNYATCIGRKRVEYIQEELKNYFKDLEMQVDFYNQLNEKIIKLPEGRSSYKIVKNYSDIESIMYQNKKGETQLTTIGVIFTIEGLHVLNERVDSIPDKTDFIKNVRKIKSWDAPPFFVSVAHHFWNHLCGHAISLSGYVANNIDQTYGMHEGITELGETIIHELLDTKNGKRILIDVKHMNIPSRKMFYNILESNEEYKKIPIIVSHGAANGLISFENKTHLDKNKEAVSHKLNSADINFFDEELILLAKRGGIFGLQLDERRVVSKDTLKNTKKSPRRNKIMHYRSELLWYQIQHIAETLDKAGLFAWDNIVIGSDFDGIIDPLNSFWTSEELPYLADFLERHAYDYLSKNLFNLPENNIKADEIIDRIMSTNGLNFLKKYYH